PGPGVWGPGKAQRGQGGVKLLACWGLCGIMCVLHYKMAAAHNGRSYCPRLPGLGLFFWRERDGRQKSAPEPVPRGELRCGRGCGVPDEVDVMIGAAGEGSIRLLVPLLLTPHGRPPA